MLIFLFVPASAIMKNKDDFYDFTAKFKIKSKMTHLSNLSPKLLERSSGNISYKSVNSMVRLYPILKILCVHKNSRTENVLTELCGFLSNFLRTDSIVFVGRAAFPAKSAKFVSFSVDFKCLSLISQKCFRVYFVRSFASKC